VFLLATIRYLKWIFSIFFSLARTTTFNSHIEQCLENKASKSWNSITSLPNLRPGFSFLRIWSILEWFHSRLKWKFKRTFSQFSHCLLVSLLITSNRVEKKCKGPVESGRGQGGNYPTMFWPNLFSLKKTWEWENESERKKEPKILRHKAICIFPTLYAFFY
jgi:hypothetical protein